MNGRRATIQVEPDDVERIDELVGGPFAGSTPDDLTHVLRKDSGKPSLAAYRAQLRRPVDDDLLDVVSEWGLGSPAAAVGCGRCS